MKNINKYYFFILIIISLFFFSFLYMTHEKFGKKSNSNIKNEEINKLSTNTTNVNNINKDIIINYLNNLNVSDISFKEKYFKKNIGKKDFIVLSSFYTLKKNINKIAEDNKKFEKNIVLKKINNNISQIGDIINNIPKNDVFFKNILKDFLLSFLNKKKFILNINTNEASTICNNLIGQKSLGINSKDCFLFFSGYQNIDNCHLLNNKESLKCYETKINECFKYNNEGKIYSCVNNKIKFFYQFKKKYTNIQNNKIKNIIDRIYINNNLLNKQNLYKIDMAYWIYVNLNLYKGQLKKENIDCNRFKEKILKDECNIILKNKEQINNNLIITNKQKNNLILEKENINNILKEICQKNTIDEIIYTNKEKFNFITQNLKNIPQNLFFKFCVNNLGYLGTESLYMSLTWGDNLSLKQKKELLLKKMKKEIQKFKKNINNLIKKTGGKINDENLFNKNGPLSLFLVKYKYWKYLDKNKNRKLFYIDKAVDYYFVLNYIIPEIDVFLKKYKQDIDQLFIKKIGIDGKKQKIGTANNLFYSKLRIYIDKIILDKQIQNEINKYPDIGSKNLGIEETKKYTKKIYNIIIEKYKKEFNIFLTEYLYIIYKGIKEGNFLNDNKERIIFLNKKGINGYFIENLFRYYRIVNLK